MIKGFIFLYGPPCAGKSSVGKLLASSLDVPFYDLDLIVEELSNSSIEKIFIESGEAVFRQWELAALLDTLHRPPGVVALGGGTLTTSEASKLASSGGSIILLVAEEAALLRRLEVACSKRPLLTNNIKEGLHKLLLARDSHYKAFPNKVDTTHITPEEAAWQSQIKLGIFRVHSPYYSYDVYVDLGGLSQIGFAIQSRGITGTLEIVSDSNVTPLYAEEVRGILSSHNYRTELIEIPAGEDSKSVNVAELLWHEFLKSKLERNDTIIALGGGVVGDLAGFCAATFLRGIAWVNIPTSLLAMIDSSIGGKTGINISGGKNLVGSFHHPKMVMIDPNILSTLPDREFRCGLAEVVKLGVVGDPELFRSTPDLSRDNVGQIEEAIKRAMAVKIRIVEADPDERGLRASLNFGHTIGHAIEAASGYQLRHGEAISIGMVCETQLADRLGIASHGLLEEICSTLKSLCLPTVIPPSIDWRIMRDTMYLDKKRRGGRIRFTLPVKIGKVEIGVEMDDSQISWLMKEFCL
jgi:shikimate kinase / 3-dehydroquinate synthase